jgi:hypothetical protein
MVHFTCDLCGKDLTATGDPRYVVKIAAYAGFDPNEITEGDLEDDHMEAVSQLLQREEGISPDDLVAQDYKGFRFDLCHECHGRFLKDPLGKELLRSFDFSKN